MFMKIKVLFENFGLRNRPIHDVAENGKVSLQFGWLTGIASPLPPCAAGVGHRLAGENRFEAPIFRLRLGLAGSLRHNESILGVAPPNFDFGPPNSITNRRHTLALRERR
jgi:hypothetical protein